MTTEAVSPSPSAPPAAPPDVPPAAPPRRRWLRALLWALAGLLLALAVALGAFWWWAGTEGSLARVLRWAAPHLPTGALHVDGLQGALRRGGQVAHLRWSHGGLTVDVHDARLRWQPRALLRGTLRVTELAAARIHVNDQRPPSGEPSSGPPAPLLMPLALDVSAFSAGTLHIEQPGNVRVDDLAGRYRFDHRAHQLHITRASVAGGRYRLQATLDNTRAATLNATLRGDFLAPLPAPAASAASGAAPVAPAASVASAALPAAAPGGAASAAPAPALPAASAAAPAASAPSTAPAPATDAVPEPMPLSVRVTLKGPLTNLLANAEIKPRSRGRAARARTAGASAAASAALAPASAASESLQAKEAVQAVEPPLSAIKKGLDTPYAQASARITPWAAQPVPEAQARFENLDLAPFWPGGPSTRLTGRASLAPPTALGPAGSGTAGWRILVQAANALPGPWDRQRLPLQALKADAEWHDGAVRVRDLNATLAEGTVQASGYWASQPAALDDVKASAAGSEASAAEAASTGGQWQLQATLQGVNPAQLHTQLAPFPLDGQATVSGSAAADAPIAFDASLQARAEAAAPATPRAGDTAAQALARDLAALRLRDATAQGQWQGRTLRLSAVRVRTADAELNGRAIEARLDERAGQGQLQLSAPGARLTLDARVAEKAGGGQLQADVSDLARTLAWVRKLPGVPADLDVGAVRGRARLKADWQGGWADPTVNAALDVPSAQWQPAAAPAQRAATLPAGKAAAKAAPQTAEKTAAETVAEAAANKSAAQAAAQMAAPSTASIAAPTAPAAATPPASGAAALAAGVRPASVAPRRAARGGGSARAPAAPAVAPYQLQGVQLRLKGRLAQATLQAQGSVRQGPRSLALNALAEGGRRRVGATLATSAWQGTLRRLELAVADPALPPATAAQNAPAAPWRVALQSPLTLSWTPEAAGGAQLNAGAGALTLAPPAGVSPAAPARVSWEPLRWQTRPAGAGTLTTRGRVQGVPLAWAGLLSASAPGEPPARVTGDAVFNGEWDVSLGATLRLHAVAERASGDVTVSAVDAETGVVSRIRAGIKTARLVLDSQGEAVTARLQWDSEHLGQAEAELRSRLTATRAPGHGGATQWAWPESAPLSGHVRARLPRIAAWSVLAPPGWRIRGALAADVQVAGTRGAPEWRGSVTASDVGLRSVADGIELRNGQLRGRLAGTRFIIDELTLQGRPPAATGQAASAARAGQGGGMLRATGEAGWADGALSARLSATIDKLHASIRPDRRVVLSGNLQASMAGSDAKLDGQLRVDEARIELPDESAPRLGDDVIVRGAGGRVGAGQSGPARASAPAATATAPAGQDGPPLTLAAQLRIDLGDAFHVRGQGIDTRLAGQLQVSSQGPLNALAAQTRVMGSVRTVGGTFRAYSQQLNIHTGVVRFTGPIDNPALDILALRPNYQSDQRVGVQITGTALLPHVRLYAQPDMPDSEKLAWLVLGRPAPAGGAEAALLQQAALALLGGRNGRSMASRFGLDELSFGGGEGMAGATVTLGKRLSDRLYATYEHSLGGVMGTLFVYYELSRRWLVRGQAGERTALDLIFRLDYD